MTEGTSALKNSPMSKKNPVNDERSVPYNGRAGAGAGIFPGIKAGR